MSYFMTLAGNPVNLTGFEPLKLIPVMQAQKYIQKLAPTLIKADGEPLFLAKYIVNQLFSTARQNVPKY
jgi:hypothetical protein